MRLRTKKSKYYSPGSRFTLTTHSTALKKKSQNQGTVVLCKESSECNVTVRNKAATIPMRVYSLYVCDVNVLLEEGGVKKSLGSFRNI